MKLQPEQKTAEAPNDPPKRMLKLLPFLLPLVLSGVIAVFLTMGLSRDPSQIPSPLIGKQVPQFELPPVTGYALGLANRDLIGEVALVNVFASWCAACLTEHPILVDLAQRNIVPIHGLNYKDAPDDAASWLKRWGNPYTRTGADVSGLVGIDWGVYGVPETFVVGADGRIAYKHIGPLTAEFVRDKLLPMIDGLRQ